MYAKTSSNPLSVAMVIATTVCWLLVFAAQPLMPCADAQSPAATNLTTAEGYELRTYEVGDLVLNVQDHPYSESLQRGPTNAPRGGGFGGGGGGGGFGGGGGGGGFFSVPDDGTANGPGAANSYPMPHVATTRLTTPGIRFCQFGGGGMSGDNRSAVAGITLDDLRRVLTNTVVSDSWAVNGGEGQVETLGTALVVWQTQTVHGYIKGLLEQLRQGSDDRRTVTVDARWLLLNSDELDRLILTSQPGVPQVDRDVLSEFTRRAGSIRGITNCFSSQLVYLVSGTRRNVVSSYIPVVGSVELPARDEQLAARHVDPLIQLVSETSAVGHSTAPNVGYQPVIEKPNLGALLEIRPTLIPSGSAAVVDLKSTITVSVEPSHDLAGIAESAAITPRVDRIAIETQEFATTLRVPLGKPILVGGLTHVPASMAGTESGPGTRPADRTPAAGADNPQLYFVLEVR